MNQSLTESNKTTVQNIVLDKKNRILLVHDKAKIGGKPAGWGLPGGKIEDFRTLENLVEQVRLYGLYGDNTITPQDIDRVFYDKGTTVEDPMIFLTGVKELVEESGYLGIPEQIIFIDRDGHNDEHEIVILKTNIIAGNLCQRSIETDDCRWFLTHSLPDNLYNSHYYRIQRSLVLLKNKSRVGYCRLF